MQVFHTRDEGVHLAQKSLQKNIFAQAQCQRLEPAGECLQIREVVQLHRSGEVKRQTGEQWAPVGQLVQDVGRDQVRRELAMTQLREAMTNQGHKVVQIGALEKIKFNPIQNCASQAATVVSTCLDPSVRRAEGNRRPQVVGIGNLFPSSTHLANVEQLVRMEVGKDELQNFVGQLLHRL